MQQLAVAASAMAGTPRTRHANRVPISVALDNDRRTTQWSRGGSTRSANSLVSVSRPQASIRRGQIVDLSVYVRPAVTAADRNIVNHALVLPHRLAAARAFRPRNMSILGLDLYCNLKALKDRHLFLPAGGGIPQ